MVNNMHKLQGMADASLDVATCCPTLSHKRETAIALSTTLKTHSILEVVT
jgi:hypothetical protein